MINAGALCAGLVAIVCYAGQARADQQSLSPSAATTRRVGSSGSNATGALSEGAGISLASAKGPVIGFVTSYGLTVLAGQIAKSELDFRESRALDSTLIPLVGPWLTLASAVSCDCEVEFRIIAPISVGLLGLVQAGFALSVVGRALSGSDGPSDRSGIAAAITGVTVVPTAGGVMLSRVGRF
jgi:hypothetical protein